MRKNSYPFTAIIGQEPMKKALLLNWINPKIGGVLIYGEKGTAKSTAVRAFSALVCTRFVEVPLGISEERLVGTVDVEATLSTGQPVLEKGLLYQAHQNILYIDEVNLLPDYLTDLLLVVSATGENHIEREGISYRHPCSACLVGTMNPEEGVLRPHFLDRFGLSVSIQGEENPEKRVQILKYRMAYEEDPIAFCKSFQAEENRLRNLLLTARRLLPDIVLQERQQAEIVKYCLEAGIEGHRGDLILGETARALAALSGRTIVSKEDIQEAAGYVLPHRQKAISESPPPPSEQEASPPPEAEAPDTPGSQQEESSGDFPSEEETSSDAAESVGTETKKQNARPKPENFHVGESFQVKSFGYQADRKRRNGHGKRSRIKSASKTGRYLSSTARRINDDLALDATIRAAAPYQSVRKKNGVAIAIEREDIREKIRQRKAANLLVFVLDTSGSMGANRRMIETKGAVLSLLKDAYVKRDKIALVTFGGKEAVVSLPPTSSPERGYRLLENLTIGGKTPLNDGISKGLRVIQNELRKAPDLLPLMVIITDGKGNVPLQESAMPKEELMELAEHIRKIKKIQTMVIDIEKKGFMKMDLAKRLAETLGSTYYPMDTLQANDLLAMVAKERSED